MAMWLKENRLCIIMNLIYIVCILLIIMKVIFKIIKEKDLSFSLWKMEVNMKENFKKMLIVERGHIISVMVINMKEDLKIIKKKENLQ